MHRVTPSAAPVRDPAPAHAASRRLCAQVSPPAKAARASAGDSPSRGRERGATAEARPATAAPGARAPAAPARPAEACNSPRVALAELLPLSPQRAPVHFKQPSGPNAAAPAQPMTLLDDSDDDVICMDAPAMPPPPRRPKTEAGTPARATALHLSDDDDDDDKLPEVPWSHLRPARPAATPASTRKVKPEELWPADDDAVRPCAFMPPRAIMQTL